MSDLSQIQQKLGRALLEIGAVKFQPANPFTWASGYRMPIYNDNRLLLGSFEHRSLVRQAFFALAEQKKLKIDCVAGTATAGIPHATTLADALQLPLVYVREKAKAHGMNNQIEGRLKTPASVVLIEDVVSTGESSLRAVSSLREAGASVCACLAIYSYDFPSSIEAFRAQGCPFHSILQYDLLVDIAVEQKTLSPGNVEDLRAWRLDPFGWGEKRGFHKVTSK